jgi:DNA-binding GntR family transcriptional regulator
LKNGQPDRGFEVIRDPNINPSTAQCLRQIVSQRMHRMIVSGELRPGQRLIQQGLARQMGVSQSVIREAMLELQFTGLIESTDNLGMFVASVNSAKLFQAYDVREMLEGLAARSCCQTTSIADIRELTVAAERIYDLGVNQRDKERADLDRHFHDLIFDLAQNEVLNRLAGAYHIVRLVVLKVFPHEQVREDHLKIVEAIRQNDADGAERAARQHVVNAREMIEQQIAREGFRVASPQAL